MDASRLAEAFFNVSESIENLCRLKPIFRGTGLNRREILMISLLGSPQNSVLRTEFCP